MNEPNPTGRDGLVVDGSGGSESAQSSRALGAYQPSLDGLRWIAMTVMLAFHAGFVWGQGAAFSLSQFFTLSGFLITSLLLRGRDARGRLDLKRFWSKRFRRLMPAAMLTLAGIVIFAVPFADGSQLAKLPGQVISALFYVVNWYFVFTDQSYVAQFASPSPVVHFWSLAVEEQFYLFMPLAMAVLLRKTASMKVLAVVFGAAAAASALWMITLYQWGASIDRLYYGTDTRAAEFLVGAALACWLAYRPLRLEARGRRVLSVASLVVLAITIWLWTSVPLTDPALYQGGFFAFSLLTTVLIVALLARTRPLTGVFSWGPLPALGRITYGVYLVQWPIFLWLDEERMGLSRWPLLVFQLSLIMGLATLMYHLIELPIRSGQMVKGPYRWVVAPAMAAVICVGVFVVSADGEGDPLAPLSEVASEAPPEVLDDGVVSLLVIGDEANQPVTARLVEAADGRDDLEVTVGPPFGCPIDDGRCQGWPEKWIDAAETIDPDVVVLPASSWSREEMIAAAGLAQDASDDEVQAWFESTMNDTVRRLTARGAVVLWAPTTVADLDASIDEWATPFGATMMALPAKNASFRRTPMLLSSDLDTAEGRGALDDAAAEIIDQALLLDRVGDGGGTRVLVVGDSIAASLGVGLADWAADSGEATVWTTAQLGCGVIFEGTLEWPLLDRRSPAPDHCLDIDDQWVDQVERFDPDVVVMHSTVWDAVPRRLDGSDEFLRPGEDRAFDQYLLDNYIAAVDVLSARGARVIWLDGLGTIDPSPAFDHLSEETLPALAAARPGQVEIYPFSDLAYPDGVETDALGSLDDVRPDGIHFSPTASRWLADRYAPDVVAPS